MNYSLCWLQIVGVPLFHVKRDCATDEGTPIATLMHPLSLQLGFSYAGVTTTTCEDDHASS